jgi:signal transduction histidine kinase/ligand-binding sensor domain-containing protein/CheY-like chemotaxis protein
MDTPISLLRFVATLVLMVWQGVGSFGQAKVKFQHYNVDHGLSQNYIFCMIQDKRGFLWLGTEDGLNRFDGRMCKVYRNDPDDPNSLSYSNIRALYEDRQGYIWAGTITGELNRFDLKTEKFERFALDAKNLIPQNEKIVTAIAEDSFGGLWVSTSHSGVFYKKDNSSPFTPLELPVKGTGNLRQPYIYAIALDQNGELWFGTGRGLFKYESSQFVLIPFPETPADSTTVSPVSIRSLSNGPSGRLWIGTSKGVGWYDPLSREFYRLGINLPVECSLDSINVKAILEDGDNLWICSPSGLLKFDTRTKCYQRFFHNSFDLYSISNNYLYGLLLDREGGVWIGTRSGVNRYDDKLHRFRHFTHEPLNPFSLPEKNVWTFNMDKTSTLWVGTQTRQVPYSLDKGIIADNELEQIIQKQVAKPKRRFLIEDRRGNILASAEGLFVINRESGAVKRFTHNPSDSSSLGNNAVWRAYESSDGLIWLKTASGMSVFFPERDSFQNFYDKLPDGTPFKATSVTDFYEDRQGNMWLGLRGNGILLVNLSTNYFRYFQHDSSDPQSLSDNVVHVIHQDFQGRMWVSTPSGLNVLTDPEKGIFRRIGRKEGLSNDYVYGVLEDHYGRLWMSTNMGIERFDLASEKFKNYNVEDGIQGNEFNDDSYLLDLNTGEMFFGGVNGFTAFHPDSIRDDTFSTPVVFTRFQYLMQRKSGSVMVEEKGISEKTHIKLSHKQRILISFEFVALSFSKPQKNQYAYQLKGYNEDWIYIGNNREVTFTNLSPGQYILRVKGSNGDGYWNETPAELHITILPPWYWAWHSKSLYLLLFAGLLYAFYRFQLKRRLAQAEALRLRELDSVKTRLYTNITHEFRTPLTVILGMADKIEEAPRQWLREGVKTIRRNGRNLLRLVNQMLDLARLEGGALPLTMIQGDIVAHLKTMMEMYRSYADAKNIAMEFVADPEHLVVDYDPHKIGDIVSNLLSNALKFTPAGGKVVISSQRYAVGSMQLAVGSSPSPLPTAHRLLPTGTAHRLPPTAYCLLLTVQDTGPGIAPEKLPYIFDRFYQADDSATRRGEGTGIGLALTHELVKLLGGSITVQSEPGQGTAFIVRLPVSNEAPLQEALPALQPAVVEMPAPQHAPSGRTPGKLPLALIVEDNADVTRLLVANLKDRYRIETAPNGRKGVEKAIKIIPDVIISDVMMPEMDGFELCRTLKEDMRSSHIPIVLLTARADVDSRIEGLEMGADAYLAKPFNQQELEVSLRKSLELRERLRERYAGGHVPDEPATAVFGRDDAFVHRLNELLHANYANPDISAKDIEKGMLMSSSQLLRKMKSLLNTTPQKYLRSYRLKQAKHLLETTDMKANEVGDAVGFGDQAYFTNAFSREFGMPPGSWRG